MNHNDHEDPEFRVLVIILLGVIMGIGLSMILFPDLVRKAALLVMGASR